MDRGSWQRFIGLADGRDLPDARTLWHFKNQLAQTGSAADRFAAVQAQLNAAGLIAKGGQMIDATIVPSPRMHFTQQEKQSLAQGKTPQHWSNKQAAHKDTMRTGRPSKGNGITATRPTPTLTRNTS